jgi:hypothetical protein
MVAPARVLRMSYSSARPSTLWRDPPVNVLAGRSAAWSSIAPSAGHDGGGLRTHQEVSQVYEWKIRTWLAHLPGERTW